MIPEEVRSNLGKVCIAVDKIERVEIFGVAREIKLDNARSLILGSEIGR
jgi:hypothetical protein